VEPTIQGYRYSIEQSRGYYVIRCVNGYTLTKNGKWIPERWIYDTEAVARHFADKYRDKPQRSAEEQAKILEEAGW
jgi:Mn-dependent DtxR family transcriptional regulator